MFCGRSALLRVAGGLGLREGRRGRSGSLCVQRAPPVGHALLVVVPRRWGLVLWVIVGVLSWVVAPPRGCLGRERRGGRAMPCGGAGGAFRLVDARRVGRRRMLSRNLWRTPL